MAIARNPIECSVCGHKNHFKSNPMSPQQKISMWVGDNGGNYPTNCAKCGASLMGLHHLSHNIQKAIIEKLEDTKPVEQDKSVMIKLTPDEILNIAKMGAEYWLNASKNNTSYTMEQVCSFHVDMAIGILKQTDPDRFIFQS